MTKEMVKGKAAGGQTEIFPAADSPSETLVNDASHMNSNSIEKGDAKRYIGKNQRQFGTQPRMGESISSRFIMFLAISSKPPLSLAWFDSENSFS